MYENAEEHIRIYATVEFRYETIPPQRICIIFRFFVRMTFHSWLWTHTRTYRDLSPFSLKFSQAKSCWVTYWCIYIGARLFRQDSTDSNPNLPSK